MHRKWRSGMNDDQNSMEILDQLDAGQIEASEAARRLSEEGVQPTQKDEVPNLPKRWRNWWVIPLSIGFAIGVMGWGLSQLGGLWWACTGPLMVLWCHHYDFVRSHVSVPLVSYTRKNWRRYMATQDCDKPAASSWSHGAHFKVARFVP